MRDVRSLRAAVGIGLAIAIGFASSAPAGAATQASTRGCTVTPFTPYTQTVNGVRYAYASIYVSCDEAGQSGTLSSRIKEADGAPGSYDDDDVAVPQNVYFSVQAGETKRVAVIRGRCNNFDATSSEELYSTANIAIGYSNSGWAKSLQLNTVC